MKQIFSLQGYLRPVRGKYEPEIDGLRFLAILPVVIMHYIASIVRNGKFENFTNIDKIALALIQAGGFGVLLFFVISGFILSKPFFSAYLSNYEIDLKSYYIRRLKRIEPPYIITMVILFLGQYFLGVINFDFQKILASIFYSYGFAFGTYNPINPVAWSLEIEVQFYLLLPLFFSLLKKWRFSVIKVLIIFILGFILIAEFVNLWQINLNLSLLRYGHYFVAGMLLAYMECNNEIQIFSSVFNSFGKIIFIFSLLAIVYFQYNWNTPLYHGQVVALFIVFAVIRLNKSLKLLFSKKFTIIIGGMCYTIYLWHYAILHIVTVILFKSVFISNLWYAAAIFLFAVPLTLLLSFPIYKILERPFMTSNKVR